MHHYQILTEYRLSPSGFRVNIVNHVGSAKFFKVQRKGTMVISLPFGDGAFLEMRREGDMLGVAGVGVLALAVIWPA